MTVAPRYAAYADAADTGLDAPVELPGGLPATPRAPAAAQATRAASAESLQPGRPWPRGRGPAGRRRQLGAAAWRRGRSKRRRRRAGACERGPREPRRRGLREASRGAAARERAAVPGAPGRRGASVCGPPAVRRRGRRHLRRRRRRHVPRGRCAAGPAPALLRAVPGAAAPPRGAPLARCQPQAQQGCPVLAQRAGVGVQHRRWAAAGRAARPGWLPKSGLTRCQALGLVREREGRRVLTPRSDM